MYKELNLHLQHLLPKCPESHRKYTIENLDQLPLEEYKNQGEKIVVIDAALLIEDDYIPYIQKLILITCREDIQINRIIARDNCTKEEAISRINSQMSQEDKKKFADYIIDNSNSFEELQEKVLELISVLQGEKE